MKKGGYKIIDFKGAALSSTAVEIAGIFNQIVDEYDKPIMVSGVTLSGELQDDAYASVKVDDDSVTLTVYGGVITVTDDDEVTFAVSKSLEELTAEIGDLDDLETTEKDSVVGAINEVKGQALKFSYSFKDTGDIAANSDFTVEPTLPSDLNELIAIIPIGINPKTNWNSYGVFSQLVSNRTKISGRILGSGTQDFSIIFWIIYI